MLDAALKYLAELATKAAAPVLVDSGDPFQIAYAINGKIERAATAIRPRDHAIGDLGALIALANAYSTEFASVVWFDATSVVLVFDADSRIEKAKLSLKLSDPFTTLERLSTTKAKYTQKEFIRLLRIDLAGTLDPVVLLNPVRVVKFTNENVSTGSIQKGKESLGREINSRIEAVEIPDDITLAVPVYSTPGERQPYSVRCSVEVDSLEGTFRLLPLPDELERVRSQAVTSIAERLAKGLTDVPSYHGRP